MIRFKKYDEVIGLQEILRELLHTSVCEKEYSDFDGHICIFDGSEHVCELYDAL